MMRSHEFQMLGAMIAAMAVISGSMGVADETSTAKGEDTALVLADALKKSQARKAYRFEQQSKWGGGAFAMISVSATSAKGTYVKPTVRHLEEDQGKITREVYFVNDARVERRSMMRGPLSKWALSARKGKMESVIAYPFDPADKKTYTLTSLEAADGPAYRVTTRPDARKDLIIKILNAEHGSLGDTVAAKNPHWNNAMLAWTVKLDAGTGLIRGIERELSLDGSGARAIDVDSGRELLLGLGGAAEFKSTTLTIEYDDTIRVEVPKDVLQLAGAK